MATTVEGRERVLRKLAALPKQVRTSLKQALGQGANEIQQMQKRLVPKRTGNLARSIVITWGGGRVKYSSLTGATGEAGDPDLTVRISAGNSKVRYAHIIEFGQAPHTTGGIFRGGQHPGAAARPFFYPAYRALRRKVKARISRATNAAAKQVARG